MDEFVARKQAGESPSISQYCDQYPDHANEIRDLFSTLSLLEHAKEDGGTKSSHLPESMGDYQIIREIGRGGMGVVYEAEHESLGRRVALKMLPRRLVNDRHALDRFQREARAVARLHHTNIVPLFEVGSDDDQPFLAMQLITGRSLDQVAADLFNRPSKSEPHQPVQTNSTTARRKAEKQPVSSSAGKLHNLSSGSDQTNYYRWVARVGLQTAEALAYSHERGIVHRDVKPSNILEDESGVIWLTDFGLAKTDDEDLTQSGDFVGTLRYMSPERFQGHCDERADIYSLGLTLYELLTKRPAFPASDRLNLIQLIEQKDPPRPRLANPKIPRDLETIVLRAVNKEPKSRYATARTFADDLDRFLNELPIKARRQSTAEKLYLWSRRNRKLAMSLTTIVALLVLIAIGSVLMSLHSNNLAQLAEQRSKELQQNLYFSEMSLAGQSASDWFGAPTIRSRLQDWHPQVVGVDLRGWEWYYLHALSHRERIVSPELDGWVWSVDFSPSTNEYANVINGWGVQVRNAETGKVVREKQLGSARFVEWSPDGNHIAISGFSGMVVICDARTLEVVREIGTNSNREVYCVDWSPDSNRLATCRAQVESQPNSVSIWNALNGELEQSLQGHIEGVREVQWSPDGKRLATACTKETKIWDTTTWNELVSIPEVSRSLCWSPDGTKIVVGHDRVSIRDATTGNLIVPLMNEPQSGSVYTIRWRPNSSQIACGHRGGSVRIYDAQTGQQVRKFYGHTGEVRGISWSPDGSRIVSGGLKNTVRLWEVNAEDQNQMIPDAEAGCVDWSHDGNLLATGATWENRFSVWDPKTGQGKVVDHSATQIESVCWSPNDQRVAYCGRHFVRIWNKETEQIESPAEMQTWMKSLAWQKDGRLLAGASLHHEFMICDVATGKLTYHEKDANAWSVDWNQCDSQLAIGGRDGRVRVLAPDGSEIWAANRTSGTINCVRFSPNGTLLASAENGAIVVWDAASGNKVDTLDAIQEGFISVDWSPDGRRLISSSNSSVSVWDIESGHVAIKLASGTVQTVRWNPDGKRIVAGSWGRGVHIWDASRGYENQGDIPDW